MSAFIWDVWYLTIDVMLVGRLALKKKDCGTLDNA